MSTRKPPREETTIAQHIAVIERLFRDNAIKPETVKAKLVEHAYVAGLISAHGSLADIPPAIAMCAMAGRSILTLKEVQP